MKENVKNEVVEEVEMTEEINETKEGFLTKAKGFVKRNGKKVAVAAIGTVGLGLAYALGKKSSGGSDDFEGDDAEFNPIEDVEFTVDEHE